MTRAKTFLISVFKGFETKHLSVIAAGVAYYLLISVLPALVALLAVVAYLPLEEPARELTKLMGFLIPRQAVTLIEPLLNKIAAHRPGLLSFGLIATLWLASSGAKGIIAGLDIVYEVPVPRRIWTNRILAFGLTIAVGVLLMLALILTLTGPALEHLFAGAVPVQSLWMTVWPYIQWLLAATFTFTAIELCYLLAPNVPSRRHLTLPGAVIAAVTWLTLSGGLAFYFHQLGGSKLGTYGALATPVALVIWLHWGTCAILIGAQVNVSLRSSSNPGLQSPQAVPRWKSVA